MATILPLKLTKAGLDALVDAQNAETEAIQIVEVGLASAAFVAAPTLTALPHEFKRLNTVSGEGVNATTIHMTASDASADVYSVFGIGLFLADGTLFATYAQAEPIVEKASVPQVLIALDIGFETAVDAAITFGDTDFLIPPATETVKGVAEIATAAEVAAEADDSRIVTPLKLAGRFAALLAPLLARTITAQTPLTGGGDWTDDREIGLDLSALIELLDPNFTTPAETVTAINAALAPLLARTITAQTPLTGGGDWTDDREIGLDLSALIELLDPSFATPAEVNALFDNGSNANGYWETRPGGIIEQWGFANVTQPEGALAVSFPMPFTTLASINITLTILGSASMGNDIWAQLSSGTTVNGFNAFYQSSAVGQSGYGLMWRAIGK